MQDISITYLSSHPHISQVLTGFYLLGKTESYHCTLHDGTGGIADFPAYPAAAVVHYRGKTLFYDTCDGYHDPELTRSILEKCDFYFKRSFSEALNIQYFGELSHKIYPLGLNYHVTFPGNPLNKARKKRRIFPAFCYTPGLFEGKPKTKLKKPRILFYSRLWPTDEKLSEATNLEREQINAMRIQLIRSLRQIYGESFWGGIEKSPLAEALCPDLVLPRRLTRRRSYLRRLHLSDICIGSAGLHGSTGWNTGEYIAAAKAVVCEKMAYQLPEAIPCLSFETAEECLAAVEGLVSDPARCLAMQKQSYEYYRQNVRPDMLIQNTLSLVDKKTAP